VLSDSGRELELVQLRSDSEVWNAGQDNLPLADGEEIWLISDHGQIKGLAKPHVLIITDHRLLAIGSPPERKVLLALPGQHLSVAYSNMNEVKLDRSEKNLSKSERSFSIQWVSGPHDDTYRSLKGMMTGERPRRLVVVGTKGIDGFPLPESAYLGGHGCSLPSQTPGTLVFSKEEVRFYNRASACVWQTAVGSLTAVEFGGPGRWKKGGRFFGGGFGAVGAAEGMLIAAALNQLTSRTGVSTVVHLEGGSEMSTWWQHTRQTPEQLQMRLSWLVSAVKDRSGPDPSGPGETTDLVGKISQLVLTDQEFSAAKARLLS
jgi:hypothetical protein